jgi:hypothetical protein
MRWLVLLQVLFDVQASSIRPGVERSLFTGQVEVSRALRLWWQAQGCTTFIPIGGFNSALSASNFGCSSSNIVLPCILHVLCVAEHIYKHAEVPAVMLKYLLTYTIGLLAAGERADAALRSVCSQLPHPHGGP